MKALGEHGLHGSRVSLEALMRHLAELARKDFFGAGIYCVERLNGDLAGPEFRFGHQPAELCIGLDRHDGHDMSAC